jgi:kinesin family protein 6/9
VYDLDQRESGDVVTFAVPKDSNEGFVNNKKEEYKFRFEKIFNLDSEQDDIFRNVAEPVIEKYVASHIITTQ